MNVQAELSLYALGQADLLPSIYEFVRRLERPGLHLETGRMSSLLTGESSLVFAALGEAYAAVADGEHKHVLVVKMVNDPRPPRESQ
jgi:uncharacterized protein YqgV (UPF0045/DUF77 family)